MTFYHVNITCEEMQNNLPLQPAAELFLYPIKHWSVSGDTARKGWESPLLSPPTEPLYPRQPGFCSAHRIHSARAWQQHTEVAPCIHAGLKQEVTQLFSCTHLVICLLQQHGAVFSCLPAKSIFCSHSWEPYRWYRSLLPGVQSAFLLGCTLCL